MHSRMIGAVAASAALAAACTSGPDDIAEAQPAEQPPGEAQTAEPQSGRTPSDSPYKPVATNLELMESIIAHAAEEYWGAVRIVIDEDGVTEHFPETDEEWEEVWAAGMSLAESGNLLMMPSRAVDDEWIRIAGDLVDVGAEAARAAEMRDTDAVLEVGERVYNVCVDCHDRYIPEPSPSAP